MNTQRTFRTSTCRRARGSVSILLTFMIVPMFLLAGLVIDGSRLTAGKSMISGAGDLTMNAALAEYDAVLKDVYGLFAISKDPAELTDNLMTYFNNSLTGSTDLNGQDAIASQLNDFLDNTSAGGYSNFIEMRPEQFSIKGVTGSQLTNSAAMKKQIIEYMKYRGPANMLFGFGAKLGLFKEVDQQNNAIVAKINYDSSLSEIQNKCGEAYQQLTIYNSDAVTLTQNVSFKLKLQSAIECLLVQQNEKILTPDEQGEITKQGLSLLSVQVEEDPLLIAAALIKEVKADYQQKLTQLERCQEALTAATKALDNLTSELQLIIKERSNYQQEVGKLSPSDFKSAMQDANVSASNIDQEKLEELKLQMDERSKLIQQSKDELENITCLQLNIPDITSSVLQKALSTIPCANSSEIHTQAQTCFDTKWNELRLETLQPISSSQPFFKFLSKQISKENQQEKNEAKSTRKQLLTIGDAKKSIQAEGTASGTVSALLPSGFSTNHQLLSSYDAANVDPSASDKEIAKSQRTTYSGLGAMGNFNQLANAAAENILIEEYITEMFSCLTSDQSNDYSQKQLQTLSGVSLSEQNNHFYKGEVEYILWGNDEVDKNIGHTKSLLFGIRFALNSCYAFTSSEIQQITLKLAIAIAGWTGFGVPIAQTALTIAFALAESKIDLEELAAGKAVPIYKSSSTWHCSLTGLAKLAAGQATEFAEQKIDDVFNKVEEFGTEKADELIDSVNQFADRTTQAVIDSATGAIVTPIQKAVTEIISSVDQYSEAELNSLLTKVFDSVRSSISEDGNTIMKEAKLVALAEIQATCKEQLLSLLLTCKQQVEQISNSIINQLEQLISNTAEHVNQVIHSKLNSIGASFKDEMTSAIQSGKENVKEIVSTGIEKFASQFKDADANNPRTSSASAGITLTYKEYLKIFVLLSSFRSEQEDAMLTRVGNLIQVNMTNGTSDYSGTKHFIKDTSFNLSNKYSYVKLDAEVGVKTNFLSIPFSKSQNKFDLSKLGSGFQTIEFHGVSGY